MSKLYKGECKSYFLKELSEQAKQKAYEQWYSKITYYNGGNEVKETLERFCDYFDVDCYSWDFNSYDYNYKFRIENDILIDNENISGIRLAKYVWNNYAKYITKGKYFSLWSKTERSMNNPSMDKLKSRYSKVMTSMEDCPLTGVCFDCDALDPIIKCLAYQTLYNSYENLINECLDSLFKAARDDCEYAYSMERFEEDAINNEWEYNEDGSNFILPLSFQMT